MDFILNDIHLESSTKCSAKCFMCPHDELNRKGEMDFELYKKITDDAISLGCKRITPFRIGDPLLFKDLFRWIDYINAEDVYVSLFTNASNLTEEIADELLERGQKLLITISFHGWDKDSYERNMRLNFERVRSNICNFMEKNKIIPTLIYSLGLNTSQLEIDKFHALWDGMGFNGISGPSESFMEWTGARKVSRTKLDIFKENPEKCRKIPCDYVLHHMDVMYDGKVCLCCVDFQGEIIFGDLVYQSISDVYSGRLYQYWLDQHHKNGGMTLPLCKDCSTNVEVLY